MSRYLRKGQSSPKSSPAPEIAEQPPAADKVTNNDGLTRAEQDELSWVRSILDEVQMDELYDE